MPSRQGRATDTRSFTPSEPRAAGCIARARASSIQRCSCSKISASRARLREGRTQGLRDHAQGQDRARGAHRAGERVLRRVRGGVLGLSPGGRLASHETRGSSREALQEGRSPWNHPPRHPATDPVGSRPGHRRAGRAARSLINSDHTGRDPDTMRSPARNREPIEPVQADSSLTLTARLKEALAQAETTDFRALDQSALRRRQQRAARDLLARPAAPSARLRARGDGARATAARRRRTGSATPCASSSPASPTWGREALEARGDRSCSCGQQRRGR